MLVEDGGEEEVEEAEDSLTVDQQADAVDENPGPLCYCSSVHHHVAPVAACICDLDVVDDERAVAQPQPLVRHLQPVLELRRLVAAGAALLQHCVGKVLPLQVTTGWRHL